MIPAVTLLSVAALATASPDAAQAGCKKSGVSVEKLAKKTARGAIQCLFNKNRSAKNVKRNGDLEQAAQNHAGVMASQSCYSHQCPGEPSLRDRVARTGYFQGSNSYGLGEVIAVQSDNVSPRRLVGKWIGSSSHRAIITTSSFDHVGVGLSLRGGRVWAAADFGHR